MFAIRQVRMEGDDGGHNGWWVAPYLPSLYCASRSPAGAAAAADDVDEEVPNGEEDLEKRIR